MGNTSTAPVFKLLVTLIVVGVLTWFAGISQDSGRAAVAIIVVFWILWFFNNQATLDSFRGKLA
jgi:hypothetical protein